MFRQSNPAGEGTRESTVSDSGIACARHQIASGTLIGRALLDHLADLLGLEVAGAETSQASIDATVRANRARRIGRRMREARTQG